MNKSYYFVVINTYNGPFHYNRLPFRISSVPAIFQRTMESLLQGIPGVAVNNILMAGESIDRILYGMLKKLDEAGLKLKHEKCEVVPWLQNLLHAQTLLKPHIFHVLYRNIPFFKKLPPLPYYTE